MKKKTKGSHAKKKKTRKKLAIRYLEISANEDFCSVETFECQENDEGRKLIKKRR